MTNSPMPEKYKSELLDGVNEIDLVRSGLDDMMIDGFQEVKKSLLRTIKLMISGLLHLRLLSKKLQCLMIQLVCKEKILSYFPAPKYCN